MIYRVTHFGEPSLARPELGETLAPHADMLRYDLGFHDPAQPDRIVLPVFGSKHGRTNMQITEGRWRSFSCKLTPCDEEYVPSSELMGWITYKDEFNKTPVTMADFMKLHKFTKIAGWR